MDELGFSALLRRTWDRFSTDWARFAHALTRSANDAEDLVSTAVTRVLNVQPPVRSEIELHRYVLKAIRSLVIDQHRRRRSRHKLLKALQEESAGGEHGLLTVVERFEERLNGQQLNDAVLRHLLTLPKHMRDAIELYFLSERELTYREVGKVLQVSPSTAHGWVQTGLELLAKAVREDLRL